MVNLDNLPAELNTSNNVVSGSYEFYEYVPEEVDLTLLYFPKKTMPNIAGEMVRGLTSADFNKDNKTDLVFKLDPLIKRRQIS